ncbi:peptidoglycan D,D-transpeptidase FtsI family protein [Williamsia deligens]|uniref:Penicillin-binding transpeptidase domain-containing protein n=1 Tax=Williamsia deligens TaxID=321325 RepID=A0ABW3GDH9_9NOCA|nr:penicillin-binding transpeptidase domain-containing protein [Williamsia deligens]MCP2195864.1 cell division protein FtsI (penicillin-binding protein 3) [Williamsia deligens]
MSTTRTRRPPAGARGSTSGARNRDDAPPRAARPHSGTIRGDGRASASAPSRRPKVPQFVSRTRLGALVLGLAVVLVAGKLVSLQVFESSSLSAQAADQRAVTEVLAAKRGPILDRNGKPIAYTEEARALTFQPVKERAAMDAAHAKDPAVPDASTRIRQIADGVYKALGGAVTRESVLSELQSSSPFVYLARSVSMQTASSITDEFPEIGAERQDIRLYPGGALAANVVGDVDFDGNGLIGLESSMDSTLHGTDGSRTYDRGSDGAVIPGSTRNVHPAADGRPVQLTLDSDVQWFVQTQVQKAKQLSGAKNASAVVLDAHTGEVIAMANDGTFDASKPLGQQQNAQLGNLPVTSPFEPGSVNKLITASAAIEYGLTTPTQIHQVPGSIDMSGVTVHDAWVHGVAPYTTTGIFGKSSNVGTLMLARQVGEDRFAALVQKFGLGQRTQVGLPGESSGEVPARSQWSGGTFANLPIGQGLSMTLLQMTSMYQAIANDGVRVPPRIVRSTGSDDPAAPPAGVRVVSPQTAQTVRDMFRAIVQRDPMGEQQGTGSKGAIPGYQVSAKTGTAQQVDPNCGCYSNSSYNITFAGITPSDDPRFVVGIMLDNPSRSSDGSGGQSAAPLFETIASWMLQREHVPMSARPAPEMVLQAT